MGAGLEVWREGRCWGLSPHEELTGRTGPETEHRKNRLLMTLEANEQADVQEGRAVTVLHAPQLPLPKAHKMRLDADRLLRRWPVCSPPAERPDNCLALEAWGRLGAEGSMEARPLLGTLGITGIVGGGLPCPRSRPGGGGRIQPADMGRPMRSLGLAMRSPARRPGEGGCRVSRALLGRSRGAGDVLAPVPRVEDTGRWVRPGEVGGRRGGEVTPLLLGRGLEVARQRRPGEVGLWDRARSPRSGVTTRSSSMACSSLRLATSSCVTSWDCFQLASSCRAMACFKYVGRCRPLVRSSTRPVHGRGGAKQGSAGGHEKEGGALQGVVKLQNRLEKRLWEMVSRLFFGCLGGGNVLLSFIGVFQGTMKIGVAGFVTLAALLGLRRRSVASPSQTYSQN